MPHTAQGVSSAPEVSRTASSGNCTPTIGTFAGAVPGSQPAAMSITCVPWATRRPIVLCVAMPKSASPRIR